MRPGLAAVVLLAALPVTRAAGAQKSPSTGPSGATPASEGQAEQKVVWPRLLHDARAAYLSNEARSSRVVLALTVGADGKVHSVEVLEAGGEHFDEAAVAAARGLVFEPAEVNGRPAAVRIKYAYDFAGAHPAPTAPPGSAPFPVAPPPSPTSPREIVVRGARERADVASVTIASAQASHVAGTQGDPLKVVENLPGLGRPSFGSGQLVVWGAAPSETRTYVDGVEVPALFHGGALRSTINGELVRNVTLTPGAYGPDYGRAIGGTVRVETKDLPAGGVHGYVAADTLDGSAMTTASLGERVRVGVAGRYGWIDKVLPAFDPRNADQFFAVPRYSDYQAKVQLRLRHRESCDVVFLGSNDDLTQNLPDSDPARAQSEASRTQYQRLYVRYRYEADDGGTVDVTPWIGRDTSDVDASFGENPATLDESTWRWGVRASHRSHVVGPLAVTLGVDLAGSNANVHRNGSLLIPPREGDIDVFGQPPGNSTNADSWSAGVVDVAPYVSADLELGPLSVTSGIRVDGFLLHTSRQTPPVGETPSIGYEQLDAEVEPRISARLAITPRLSLLGAAGIYSQPPDPADLSAVFGNPTLGVETADHATVGEELRLTQGLSLEAVSFYRWMSDLAVRNPSSTPRLAEALVPGGVGRAYGAQMLLRQQPWHGFFGWIAYTISRSERRDTTDAGWRLFDYDEPHVLTAVGSKELGAWTVGARLRFATGLPRTPVVGALYDAKDDTYQPLFGVQNSIRLPTFWQLDLRIDRSFRLRQGARLLVYVEGLNVMNRPNGEEYFYNVDYTRRGTITGLPAIAVVGAKVEL